MKFAALGRGGKGLPKYCPRVSICFKRGLLQQDEEDTQHLQQQDDEFNEPDDDGNELFNIWHLFSHVLKILDVIQASWLCWKWTKNT